MTRQDVTITFFDGVNETKLDVYYTSDKDIEFEDFFYRFLNSDADVCKLNDLHNEDAILITKKFTEGKIIITHISKYYE
jgi:hypothetical protein